MTKEELEKLKQIIDYFRHWHDATGEESVSILEKSVKYITELEQTNSETIAQINLDNGELIIENEKLRKENEELKKHIENIYANHCGNCNRNILNTRLKKENADLEAQIEKMKNQKVFLLQRVDAHDSVIDKQFYTTDEELAKEWDACVKHSYWYGEAIELKEFSDKERLREELENG